MVANWVFEGGAVLWRKTTLALLKSLLRLRRRLLIPGKERCSLARKGKPVVVAIGLSKSFVLHHFS
jgi:hypothetical protein